MPTHFDYGLNQLAQHGVAINVADQCLGPPKRKFELADTAGQVK